nr:DsbA family protein [Paraburkholderia nemoris]
MGAFSKRGRAGRGRGSDGGRPVQLQPGTAHAKHASRAPADAVRPGRNEAQKTAALYHGIYAAYFAEGRDIGSLDTLVAIAAEQAFDADQVRAYLQSATGNQEIDAARSRADKLGVQAVPTIVIAGELISGAQPAAVFANALRSAGQRSAA